MPLAPMKARRQLVETDTADRIAKGDKPLSLFLGVGVALESRAMVGHSEKQSKE